MEFEFDGWKGVANLVVYGSIDWFSHIPFVYQFGKNRDALSRNIDGKTSEIHHIWLEIATPHAIACCYML